MFSSYAAGTLIAVIVVLIWVKVKKRLSYFQDRGLPYVPYSWKDFTRTLSVPYFVHHSNEIYEMTKNQGDYTGFFMMSLKPVLMVTEASLVQDIYIKDFNHFQDHGLEQDPTYNPLLGHLLNMKGDQWRTMRHMLVPAFTSGKLKGMLPVIEECADTLIKDMKEDDKLRIDTNMKDLFSLYTLSVIAKCAFGIEFEDIRNKDSMFHRVQNAVFRPSFFRVMKLMVIISLPRLASMLRITYYPKYINDFFFSLTKDAFKLRTESGTRRNDFIQLLLELKNKGKIDVDSRDLEEDEKINIQHFQPKDTANQIELTDELLTAQVFVFLGAGFETSSYVLTITSYLLSKHPDIQQQVRDEIRTTKSKYGEVNYLALRDMKLLDACINEALRLYPSLFFNTRECTKSYKLKDGKMVEKGTIMVIPVRNLQTDSRYWKEALKFDPHRFLTQEKIQPGTYFPFGDGPRICIAQRLVLLITKMMMMKLLENFEILPSSKTLEPVQITMNMSADILGGAWANFKPLHN